MAFPARFPGKCANCGMEFPRGELITWSRRHKGKAYHVACANGAQHAEPEVVEQQQEQINPAAVTPTPNTHSQPQDALGVLATAIAPYLDSRFREIAESVEQSTGAVLELVRAEIERHNGVTRVEVKGPAEQQYRDLGLQHSLFPLLLAACSARTQDGHGINCWLKGPAGSGKTTAAANVAKALNLPFQYCGSISDAFALLGFIDASGRYQATAFRRAYQDGGVFLFDEVDGSDANALLAFNAAIANGHCAFPDGMVERHRDCIIIAAANTWGLGARDEYVGRMKLDGAFLDRFVSIDWTVDESLERATGGNLAWCERVQGIRAKVRAKGIKVLVTPRATYYGAALLAAGIAQEQVESMTIRKAMTPEQWQEVS